MGLVLVVMGGIGACEPAEDDIAVPPSSRDARAAKCWRAAKPLAVEDEPMPEVDCSDGRDAWDCYGSWAVRCRNGRATSVDNCRVAAQACAANRCEGDDCVGGCLACAPSTARCEGNRVMLCKRDGSGYEAGDTCDDGTFCSQTSGQCEDLCAKAEASNSYVGCEYWAVPTLNSNLVTRASTLPRAPRRCELFPFALVVSNTEGVPAHVTVDNPGGSHRLTVAPGEVETLELPCGEDGDLFPSSELMGADQDGELRTRTSRNAAYHVTSDVPVTVYQFNPLEFAAELNGDEHFSYTNDASLLLPVHALTGNYTVMTRQTWSTYEIDTADDTVLDERHYPGFVAITATSDEPTRVRIEVTAHTRRNLDNSIPALSPGDSVEVSLRQGETLQLVSGSPSDCRGEASDLVFGIATHFCVNGRSYDLSGSRIRADRPVSVIAGHNCTFIPRDRAACDHLEEAIFPEETLGREALVSVVEPSTCDTDIPTLVRILSTADDNEIAFTPPIHDRRRLAAGEFFEFEAFEDFKVEAEKPILVGQFLVGQDYERGNARVDDELGDPAFGLVAPVEQWREQYAILVPDTLPNSFVNVMSYEGAQVVLDGRLLEDLTPFGDTGFAATRVKLEPGAHRLTGTNIFGLTVYGYASYTSYMIPGGLDLVRINAPK